MRCFLVRMHLEGSTLLLNALGVESPPLISHCVLSCISRSVQHIQKRANLPNPRRPQESDTPSAQFLFLVPKAGRSMKRWSRGSLCWVMRRGINLNTSDKHVKLTTSSGHLCSLAFRAMAGDGSGLSGKIMLPVCAAPIYYTFGTLGTPDNGVLGL